MHEASEGSIPMVITELQNRRQALEFLNALRGVSGSLPTERSYAAHIVFLVSSLEIAEAKLLLENLIELDEISGPYVACHVLVDCLGVNINETLVGIYQDKPEKRMLSVAQIEGLCANKRLNHIELEDIEPGLLTFPVEVIARNLGIVGRVPCVLLLEAPEVVSKGEVTVLDFPRDSNALSRLIREVVGPLVDEKGKFHDVARALEDLHDLFDQRQALRTSLGAPWQVKREIVSAAVDAAIEDPDSWRGSLRRAAQAIGDSVFLSPKETSYLHDLHRESKLSANGLLAPSTKLLADRFASTFDTGVEAEKQSLQVKTLEELKALVIHAVLDQVEMRDVLVREKLSAINGQISAHLSVVRQGPSLVRHVSAKKTRVKSKALVEALGKEGLRAGLKDVAKPSFWMKLLGM
jgi:hypothetical protein